MKLNFSEDIKRLKYLENGFNTSDNPKDRYFNLLAIEGFAREMIEMVDRYKPMFLKGVADQMKQEWKKKGQK